VAEGSFHANCGLILAELEQALRAVDESQVERLVAAILQAEKVFAVGLGRVLLSMQAMVKRLNHLGVRAWCVGEIN
jgi:6-phospho-3-hexuloisomerase